MFLTETELRDFTGRQRASAQARHLERLRIPFERDADGRVKVLRSIIEGSATRAPQAPPQPDFSAIGG